MNQPAKVSGQIEFAGDCAFYRPAGKLTLEQAVALVDEAIAYVRDRRIPKLFIDCIRTVAKPLAKPVKQRA